MAAISGLSRGLFLNFKLVRIVVVCRGVVALLLTCLVMACGGVESGGEDVSVDLARRDTHSYANVDEVRVTHLELDVTVLFDEKQLRAAAMLSLSVLERMRIRWFSIHEI